MFELHSVTLAALQAGRTQAQIDMWLNSLLDTGPRAIVVESAWINVNAPADVVLRKLSAGCVCCVGQVVLKVQLTQLLRQVRPQHLLLLLAQTEHLDRLYAQLQGGFLGFRAIDLHGVRQDPS